MPKRGQETIEAKKGDGGSGASRAVDRTLTLLKVLGESQAEMGTRELARVLGIPVAATYRLLATLEQHHFVRRDAATDKFSLGSAILELASQLLENIDVRRVAAPVMEWTREKCNETVSLYVVDGHERVCIERMESRQGVRSVVAVGSRKQLHSGASGKILLAYMPEEQRQAVLQAPLARFTEKTLTDPVALSQELEQVCVKGYACSIGESSPDSWSVAGPVWAPREEQVKAALTIVAPMTRHNAETERTLCNLVIEAAAEISKRLGS